MLFDKSRKQIQKMSGSAKIQGGFLLREILVRLEALVDHMARMELMELMERIAQMKQMKQTRHASVSWMDDPMYPMYRNDCWGTRRLMWGE